MLGRARTGEGVRDGSIGLCREACLSVGKIEKLFNGLPGWSLSAMTFEELLFGQCATPDFLQSVGDKPVAIGVLNLDPDGEVETPESICQLIEGAMEVVPKERISLAPDCGMWFLPREFAFAKLQAMCQAADTLRSRYG